MSFRLEQMSTTLNDLECSKRICSYRQQKVICHGRNVRLMLVLLSYLFILVIFRWLIFKTTVIYYPDVCDFSSDGKP